MKPGNLIEQAPFFVFLGLLVWAPLPFGSVQGWAQALLHLIIWVLLLVFSLQLWLGRHSYLNPSPIQYPAVLGCALAGFQLLPLFQGKPLSLDPFSTKQAALALLALTAWLVLALNLIDSKQRVKQTRGLLVGLGLGLSVLALFQFYLGNGKLYWVIPVAEGTPFGPFVNRNHYAGFMEMLVPLAVAQVLEPTRNFGKRMARAGAAVLMCGSVVLTFSRGGISSMLVGLTVFGLLLFWGAAAGKFRHFWLTALLLPGLVGICLYWVGPELLTQRFQESTLAQTPELDRLSIWRNSWNMFRDHPVAGVGMGAFPTVYPQYDRATGYYRVEQAHNDYLQLLTDTGLLGGLLGLAFLVLLVATAVRYFHSFQNNPTTQGLSHYRRAAGFFSGCMAFLTHALVDFNFQIPSNAMLFLVLIALLFFECETGTP